MVWGLFGKTEIALAFIMGFWRAICQMKGYFFPLMCSVNADTIRLIHQNILIKILFFHFYFFNQDFFLTIFSITLLFGDLVDNVHLEGIVSQNFDLSPSFHFMTKNG